MTRNDPSMSSPQGAPARSRYRLWLWIVGTPLVLAVLWFAYRVNRNWQERLTQDKLDAARARWEANGVQDYDLTVRTSGNVAGTYQVQVRQGKAIQATFNDAAFDLARADSYWIIPALFDILQQYLDHDAQPNSRRVFSQVEFDPVDGHLIRYLRRQTGSGGGQFVVIEVQFQPRNEP
jgi:hypothetical protein